MKKPGKTPWACKECGGEMHLAAEEMGLSEHRQILVVSSNSVAMGDARGYDIYECVRCPNAILWRVW